MGKDILITPGNALINFSGTSAGNINLQVQDDGRVSFIGISSGAEQLTIIDSLSGSVFTVNNTFGSPILDINFNNSITIPNGASDGYIFTSDSGGTATWQSSPGLTSGSCIDTLWTSSISGCSPVTIGRAHFPQGITVSGESVSTENQTEIFSTGVMTISMESGDTNTHQGFFANFKHPSGAILVNQINFRPSDVTSRETITYGTPGIVYADYGTIDVPILGLGLVETIELTGTTTGTTTISCGWNGVSFSGTVTVSSPEPPPEP